MKGLTNLKVFFVVVTAIAFAVCIGNICDNDEAAQGFVFDLAVPLWFEQLVSFSHHSIFLVCESDSLLRESMIVYLQLHQKSPPSVSSPLFA